jgi:predicted AAA+ superfamily ATPase
MKTSIKDIHFWRNTHQAEIDFLEIKNNEIDAFEIKYNPNVKVKFTKSFTEKLSSHYRRNSQRKFLKLIVAKPTSPFHSA